MRRRRGVFERAAAAVVALVCAAPAAAAPDWLGSSVAVAPGGGNEAAPAVHQSLQHAFVAPDGTLTVVVDTEAGEVAVYTRPPGGTFELIDTFDGLFGTVVGGPDGSVAVSYNVPGPGNRIVRVRRPGEAFSAPTTLPSNDPTHVRGAFVDEDGRFWALTGSLDPDKLHVLRREPDGELSNTPVFDEVPLIADTEMRALPGGGARIVMSSQRFIASLPPPKESRCENLSRIWGATIDAQGDVSEPVLLGEGLAEGNMTDQGCAFDAGTGVLLPALAVSPEGRTAYAYSLQSFEAPEEGSSVRARLLAPGQSWDGSTEATVDEGVAEPTAFAYAGEDVLLAARTAAGIAVFEHRDGEWGSPEQFEAGWAELAGSASGHAVIGLFPYPVQALTGPVRGVVRRPDGTLTEPRTWDDDALFLGAWADPAGNLGVTWSRDDGGDLRTELGVFDAAPPRLQASGPATASAGAGVTFEATASDDWSGIPAGVGWAFSDGGTATGATAVHAFPAGNASATATAVDGVGNSATETVPVAVTAAAGPTPDTTRPVVSRVKVKVFRKSRRARVRFTLSEDARVTLTVKRKGRKATRITRELVAGRRSIRTRKLKRRRTHTFRLVAVDAAANRSARKTVRRRVR